MQTGAFDLPLPPDEAFKLFTAEGERLWVPDWAPQMLGTLPQAPGLVFLTGGGDEATIWTVLASDLPGGLVRYSRVTPGSRAGIVEVGLTAKDEGTQVQVTYDLTALSPEGEQALEAYRGEAFAEMLRTWCSLIEQFLQTENARQRLSSALV